MSDNVGLSTPRGSGTSGFVQRNRAQIRPRDRAAPYPPKQGDLPRHKPRHADKNILAHNANREKYLEEFTFKQELMDKMEKEEHELNDKEKKDINKQWDKHQNKQLDKGEQDEGKEPPRQQFKGHQVHEMADAKEKENKKMAGAFKIPSNYEEGSHWRRQEERAKNTLVKDDEDDRERN